MHYDALTLAAVIEELNQTLRGGRVQQIVLPDEKSVGLEIYANRTRHYLLVSAHPQASRMHLVERKLRRGVEKETPLLLLLRKYVRGAIFERAEQPVAFERVAFLHFDHPEHGHTRIVIEPMGRLANLLMLDASDKIHAVLKPVTANDDKGRTLLPRTVYEFPPPQDKLPPLNPPLKRGAENHAEQIKVALRQENRLWRGLLYGVDGVSPTLGREIAWRAAGDANAGVREADLNEVVDVLSGLWSLPERGDWRPGTVLDETGEVVGFAPYELHFTGHFSPVPTISRALEAFYQEKERDVAGSEDPYAGSRGSVAGLLKDAAGRIERQLAALEKDEPEPGQAESARIKAEWLLALSSQIDPEQETLTVLTEDGDLTIQLDPQISAVEQAERLFERASKLERAAKIIPRRRAQLQADRAFMQQLHSDLALAENQPEIAAVREELREAGYLRQRKGKKQKTAPDRSKPMQFLSQEGFTILVGRNARQNEVITFKEANADDLWLHIRDLPGAHVVIRSGGQPVSEESIYAAAQLAAYFSSQRGERAVPVAVTARRFVTRMPGGRTGQVHYRNEETVTVPAEMPDL